MSNHLLSMYRWPSATSAAMHTTQADFGTSPPSPFTLGPIVDPPRRRSTTSKRLARLYRRRRRRDSANGVGSSRRRAARSASEERHSHSHSYTFPSALRDLVAAGEGDGGEAECIDQDGDVAMPDADAADPDAMDLD